MPCAARIIDAAKELAAAAHYDNLGTFEFLVDGDARASDPAFAFIEANPRLQVEHTVTEEVLGVDLVKSQLAVAAGATLGSLGLAQAYVPEPRGYAMQLRVNMEVMDETRRDQADRRHAGAVRSAVRPRRSRRYVRLCRLQDQRGLQFAARQGHRAFAGGELDRRRAEGRARTARIPDRRRRHQHPVPGGDAGASGFCRQPHQHRLHRYPCRRSSSARPKERLRAAETSDRIRRRRR